MNNVKIYESFEKVFTVDLMSLIEYTGDYVLAIYLIGELQRNSSDYFFIHKNIKYKRKISVLNDKGREFLYFEGYALSYIYLINNPENNIEFTFYDVEVSDDLSTISNANKYNL